MGDWELLYFHLAATFAFNPSGQTLLTRTIDLSLDCTNELLLASKLLLAYSRSLVVSRLRKT